MAIEAVQAQAGHRSIASTRIYLHLGADWLADEYRGPWRPSKPSWRWPDERPPAAAHDSVAVVERQISFTGRRPLPGPADGGHHGPLPGSTRRLGPSRPRSGPPSSNCALRRSDHRGRPRRARPWPRSSIVTSRRTRPGWPLGRARRESPSTTTISHRLGSLRTFFERIIDWDYDDAPSRSLIFPGDFPQARRAVAQVPRRPHRREIHGRPRDRPDPRRRLMVELLARTGIRVRRTRRTQVRRHGPSSATPIWLRIPVGKLHNDRYVPLLPRSSNSSTTV